MNNKINNEQPRTGFHALGLAPDLIAYLDRQKFVQPTPIQQQAIPLGLEGKDIVGIAQTGTGKTLAYGIPMIQKLSQQRGMGLILVPTRELAFQVSEALGKVASVYRMRTAVLIGGMSIYNQIQALKKHPHIVIATPGRLIDHLRQKTILLFDVKVLVLDEADRMLDMGFAPQIEKIMQTIPKQRQTMLFSATMPAPIFKLASAYMQLPVSVEIAVPGTAAEKITQELFIVQKKDKPILLDRLLKQYGGTVLIFTRTKVGARILTRQLQTTNYRAAEIHSDRSLSQRREALEGFKCGRYRILVATDIAARGIDVNNIAVVVNYDLPDESENYVHRIGRTARAGKDGRAISFATPDQSHDVKKIERLMRITITVSSHPEVPAAKFEYSHSAGPTSFRGRRPRRGGSGGFRRFR